MEQIPSSEANSSATSQEIPRILRYPKVHYRIHISPLSVTIKRGRSIHFVSFKFISLRSSNLRVCFPSVLFPSCFHIKTKLT